MCVIQKEIHIYFESLWIISWFDSALFLVSEKFIYVTTFLTLSRIHLLTTQWHKRMMFYFVTVQSNNGHESGQFIDFDRKKNKLAKCQTTYCLFYGCYKNKFIFIDWKFFVQFLLVDSMSTCLFHLLIRFAKVSSTFIVDFYFLYETLLSRVALESQKCEQLQSVDWLKMIFVRRGVSIEVIFILLTKLTLI